MICLVHLVWAPLGPEPLERFLASYSGHDAGAEHELLFVLNGFAPGTPAVPAVPGETLRLERPLLDLAAYRRAAAHTRRRRLVFVNSYGVVLCDGWLGKLDSALDGGGLVGCSGSWESALSDAPRPLRAFRRDFPRFPNPHLRTNGFGLSRELIEQLEWVEPTSKQAALRLEAGSNSLTRQVLARGLPVSVVGRDGACYEPERWPASATFRAGEQRNLLLGDNRTEQWARADLALRGKLEAMAWGTAGYDRPAPSARVKRR